MTPSFVLSFLQNTQKSVMDDLCNITHVYHVTGTHTTSMVTGVACGIEFVNSEQAVGLQGALVGYNVVLRLPVSQSLLITDTVELVRKGDQLISGTYQIAAYPEYNSTVQKIKLRRVKS